jgi:uncharacterized protein
MRARLDRERAAEIVHDAGGRIVGRTRFQKLAYLLELAGFGGGFQFEYRHYGPYSQELADAVRLARAFDLIEESEHPTNWGGWYSVFQTKGTFQPRQDRDRSVFAERAAAIDAVELELAATAAYLASVEGSTDPWRETAERKPEKAADGRLENAKQAYHDLLKLKTPKPLPPIA